MHLLILHFRDPWNGTPDRLETPQTSFVQVKQEGLCNSSLLSKELSNQSLEAISTDVHSNREDIFTSRLKQSEWMAKRISVDNDSLQDKNALSLLGIHEHFPEERHHGLPISEQLYYRNYPDQQDFPNTAHMESKANRSISMMYQTMESAKLEQPRKMWQSNEERSPGFPSYSHHFSYEDRDLQRVRNAVHLYICC